MPPNQAIGCNSCGFLPDVVRVSVGSIALAGVSRRKRLLILHLASDMLDSKGVLRI
ncbi:hypothetical protein AB7M56_002442 [Bradyrhizobium elkanii]|nr:hypothetical protein [Bradyrhizobium elkanii]MCS4072192.1 hypothetical protein [Bradyrhizobium elkanii]MCS4078826.1 hypothetical protein [Bradyrhizobium elkanii]MCW2122576.1 hypothetical protein [Bradyrhizobium elkanii]MCW2169323.1 hypothetical protein [Bradyrhizobium elkanii]